MGNEKHTDQEGSAIDVSRGEPWVKPEITSFEPVKASQGISYRPQDGISNLT